MATISKSVVEAIGREQNPDDQTKLLMLHESLSCRLDRVEAATIARSIVATIERDPRQIASVKALVLLSGRLDPSEAAALNSRAARSIAKSISSNADIQVRSELADALVSLSGRLDPAEARTIARTIAATIGPEDAYTQYHLIAALTSLSDQLDPAEAAVLCGPVARRLVNSIGLEANATTRSYWAMSLRPLLPWIDSTTFAQEIAVQFCSADGSDEHLKDFLVCPTPSHRQERAGRFMAAILQSGPGGTLAATIREATEPYPCRLTSQELVELLKMPTCFGATRRVVLDQLENIHGRRFANHWEFVRFAREKGLALDFTSPPRRPVPKESPGRMLDDSASGPISR